MKDWLCGKCGGLIGFVAVTVLVAGGLGWATAAALCIEGEQIANRAEADHAEKIRDALWRLDGRIAPLLAREDSRPFDHYSAVYSPPLAFHHTGNAAAPGEVIVPSPLLQIDLPPWMLLHFQVDPVPLQFNATQGWDSPQLISDALRRRLSNERLKIPLDDVIAARRARLELLKKDVPIAELLAATRLHSSTTILRETSLRMSPRNGNSDLQWNGNPPSQAVQAVSPQGGMNFAEQQSFRNNAEYDARSSQQAKRALEGNAINATPERAIYNERNAKDDGWFNVTPSQAARITETTVQLRPMTPFWLPSRDGDDHLLFMRLVQLNDREIGQGIVLDDRELALLLKDEVTDLFPDAILVPVKEHVPPHRERTMTALPFELDPGPTPPPPAAGWTPLRVGLVLAWSAAVIALLAVGLGGWSLINFSERRIRFVSAVTHELRTPLTTLRLYLDMLMNGLVRDEQQRAEYIATLHTEAERLTRLVGNVLDFSRLEKQRPHLTRSPQRVADLLGQLQATWEARCTTAGKELIVDAALPADAVLTTDGDLLQQILGNLIDNACKYSRSAEDRRIWLRVQPARKHVIFEVEDRGPGVPVSEQRAIFRVFRRGRDADVTAGGVGLGLALAKRWARLLGGRLSLAATPVEGGACFRLEMPLETK